MGALSLTSKYLTSPNFQLDELESLLSSRFLSLDEGPDFTPTLAKNQQRNSISGLPGSIPLRTSLPKSPPSSIAGQFVLPPTHSHTLSSPGSQSPRSATLPMSRTSTNMAAGGSTSALSVTSSRQEGSTTWFKEDGIPLPGAMARIRRESTSTTGRSSMDLPFAPGPLPIRRPNINPVHPFKSSTLSSGSPSIHSPSPSLRQPSPLTSGATLPGLPSRPTQTSPNSSRVPPSPIGVSRPSPPFAPSSLGDRRSLASTEGEDTSPRIPTRKRYSSSFGHRYAASGGAASDGSPSSGGERKDSSCECGDRQGGGAGTPSFLGATTDDDEISIFVQEIDARKPLASTSARQPLSLSPTSVIPSSPGSLGRHVALPGTAGFALSGSGEGSGSGSGSGEGLAAGAHQRGASAGMGAGAGVGGDSNRSSMGPMLTRESEVDEKLKHMHEVFLASLEGLASGSSRRRDNSSTSVSGSGNRSGAGRDDEPRENYGGGSDTSGVGLPSGLERRDESRLRLGSLRSMSATDVASSGGSAEVMGKLDLDDDLQPRRGYYGS
ncbi:hypothetical protein PAXRUDRAFT_834443 [Paxillus rubicundulus Ve08.2h10]|uniref:Autophagy-related protein 13 n=1 Tax=Paxillus rubicundulus Ve08.2h10 TaxID=930991 RepID=A0A0D0D571_9AGAM|nr:hypothetical protein PAXRUDRAFT_834443 [Paxillus rubicundulus Ve08.2h10]